MSPRGAREHADVHASNPFLLSSFAAGGAPVLLRREQPVAGGQRVEAGNGWFSHSSIAPIVRRCSPSTLLWSSRQKRSSHRATLPSVRTCLSGHDSRSADLVRWLPQRALSHTWALSMNPRSGTALRLPEQSACRTQKRARRRRPLPPSVRAARLRALVALSSHHVRPSLDPGERSTCGAGYDDTPLGASPIRSTYQAWPCLTVSK